MFINDDRSIGVVFLLHILSGTYYNYKVDLTFKDSYQGKSLKVKLYNYG